MLEKFSFSDFISFCKKNTLLLAITALAILFSYGIKIFWYSIGIDSEIYMMSVGDEFINWKGIGRFGLVFLKILEGGQYNPFSAVVFSVVFLWLFVIFMCYAINVFSNKNLNTKNITAFALLFAINAVWADNIYYSYQSAEIFFVIFLIPISIYLLFFGVLENKKANIIAGVLLMSFEISVYQSISAIILAEICAFTILLFENSDCNKCDVKKFTAKIFLLFIVSIILYWLTDKMLMKLVFHTEKDNYLDRFYLWGKVSAKTIIMNIFGYIYMITLGSIPFFQSLVDKFVFSGSETMNETVSKSVLNGNMTVSDRMKEMSAVFANVLLLPAVIMFWYKTFSKSVKYEKSKRFIYLGASILLPCCILILVVLGGNKPPFHSQFALPFVSAFLIYYVLDNFKKIHKIIFIIIILQVVYQMLTVSKVFYSDYLRYQYDVLFAYDLGKTIEQHQPLHNKVNVAIIGKRNFTVSKHFIHGGVQGFSFFESATPSDYFESSLRGLNFMKTLGINYEMVDSLQMNAARENAKTMPNFPKNGSVKYCEDVIVVKLSESIFGEK